MKIVYLHQHFRTPEIGGGTRSYEFAKQWVIKGHDVHVITSKIGAAKLPFTVVDGIKVHYISSRYDNSFGFRKRIFSFIKFALLSAFKASRLNPDTIYATSTPLTICLPAIYCKMIRRVNYVFEVRDLWPDVPIAMGVLRSKSLIRVARILEKAAYRFSSHIITISPTMRENVIEKGIPKNKITCITQGCDNSIFSKQENSESLSLPKELKDKKIIVYAGAISTANDLKYLVELALESKNSQSDIRFVILGEGLHLSYLREYATRLNVLNEFIYFYGHVSKFEVSKWMSVSTFTVATFGGPEALWIHGAQNKFFDSISAGKPIATNYLGWQTRFSIEENIGIYIDPSNLTVALAQLTQTINDQEWMTKAAENCRYLANNSLNRKLLAEQCLEILNAFEK